MEVRNQSLKLTSRLRTFDTDSPVKNSMRSRFARTQLEVITDPCSAFDLFKKIEKLAERIELEAGIFFSLDNWVRSTWCASPLKQKAYCVIYFCFRYFQLELLVG